MWGRPLRKPLFCLELQDGGRFLQIKLGVLPHARAKEGNLVLRDLRENPSPRNQSLMQWQRNLGKKVEGAFVRNLVFAPSYRNKEADFGGCVEKVVRFAEAAEDALKIASEGTTPKPQLANAGAHERWEARRWL